MTDVETGRVDVYGEGAGFLKRAFLTYTGLHFDAVVFSGGGTGGDLRTTLAKESSFAAAASTLAAELRSQGKFSNKDTMRLRCKVCNTIGTLALF